MQHNTANIDDVKSCVRCGGRAIYWRESIIPGDPRAPRGSNRGTAHYRPAWTCINCGYIEPQERRSGPPRTVVESRSGV